LGEVFNVGTGVETSVNKLAEIIKNHVNGIAIQNVPERDIDNIRRRSIDIEKIRQNLGWTPQINIKKGIEETLAWYKSTL
jgi:UDP-glucose 4-epimerase